MKNLRLVWDGDFFVFICNIFEFLVLTDRKPDQVVFILLIQLFRLKT